MTESTHPIRKFRKAQQPPMTLDDLAALVGVTPATLSRVETGAMALSVDLAKKVAINTGIPMATLCPDLASMFEGQGSEAVQ